MHIPTDEQVAIVEAARDTDHEGVLIPLSQGLFAIIDREDLEKVNRYKWFAHKSRNTFYAETKVKGDLLKMHHLILGPPFTPVVDHINRDGLDNRKLNLRKTDFHGNAENKGVYKNNKSGVPGVYFSKNRRGNKKWCAQITRQGKQKLIGAFETFDEAVTARKEAERVYSNR